MLLTIKIAHDRDESCNDYTLTRVIERADLDAEAIRMTVRDTMATWKASYPYKGRTPHAPVVDVTVDGVTVSIAAAA